MAIVKKFCFCCTLETGAMINGYSGAAGSIIIAVFASVYLTIMINKLALSGPGDPVMLTLTTLVSSSFINLLSSILLIIGVTVKRSALVLPWLITDMIGIIVLAGVLFIFPIILRLFASIVIIIGIYFWICILSYYQDLKSAENFSTNIRNSDEESLPVLIH